MSSNYLSGYDPISQDAVDLDSQYITDSWLVDRFVGNTLMACGYNTQGQLGDGTTVNKSSPVQVGSLTNWRQVSGGSFHTSAIKTDGTLWAWGTDSYGQSGLSGISTNTPVQVGTLTNWKQVACGYMNTVAIKTDGTLWVTGAGQFGVLGKGASVGGVSSFIQVGTATNWKQVSCGYQSAQAIKTDGTLWVWGKTMVGGYDFAPRQMGVSTDWKTVDNGYLNSYAIKTDGTLWGWGRNTNGILGQNNITEYVSPVKIGTSTNWIYASVNGAAAIKSDGTLWVCGTTTTSVLSSTFTQVGTLTNWKSVSGGAAIKTDGTLWACGGNNKGQLGLSDITDRFSPVQVGTLTNWKQVSCGYYTTFAIQNQNI